nr:hypothetical protein [uncultured Campylobacter sp.]
MKRWSKLAKRLYELVDESIDFQIHCAVYRMQSRRGGTDLPRYFITLAGEIIFDYPKNFALKDGRIKSLAQGGAPLAKFYPYDSGISGIGELIREYIDTPKDELFAKHFDADEWGACKYPKGCRQTHRQKEAANFSQKQEKSSDAKGDSG